MERNANHNKVSFKKTNRLDSMCLSMKYKMHKTDYKRNREGLTNIVLTKVVLVCWKMIISTGAKMSVKAHSGGVEIHLVSHRDIRYI